MGRLSLIFLVKDKIKLSLSPLIATLTIYLTAFIKIEPIACYAYAEPKMPGKLHYLPL